jgi:hypothetical protein
MSSCIRSRSTRSGSGGSSYTRVPGSARDDVFLHRLPDLVDVGHIFGERGLVLAFGVRARDIAAPIVAGHPREDFLQPRALGFVFDPDRDAVQARVRQQHEVARGNRKMRGQARALAADGILDHLHDHALAFVHKLVDGWGR